MAKFLLKASLIPKLEERNVINPVTGKITMRIHYPQNPAKPLTALQCVEFQFYPTDVLEVTNPFGVEVMTHKSSPRMKVGAEWFISDPAIPWFDIVDEATPTTMTIEVDGTKILTKKHRRLMREYSKDMDVPIPAPVLDNPTNEGLLELAKQHKREKLAK